VLYRYRRDKPLSIKTSSSSCSRRRPSGCSRRFTSRSSFSPVHQRDLLFIWRNIVFRTRSVKQTSLCVTTFDEPNLSFWFHPSHATFGAQPKLEPASHRHGTGRVHINILGMIQQRVRTKHMYHYKPTWSKLRQRPEVAKPSHWW
jgi:hypothetical protein